MHVVICCKSLSRSNCFLGFAMAKSLSNSKSQKLTFAVDHIRTSNFVCVSESRWSTIPNILFYAGMDYWQRHFCIVLAFTNILSLTSGHTSTQHQVKIVFVNTRPKRMLLFQKFLSMRAWVLWLIKCVGLCSIQACVDLLDVFLAVLGARCPS